MTAYAAIALQEVSYFYGRGNLRKQILHEVSLEISPGEIVILSNMSTWDGHDRVRLRS